MVEEMRAGSVVVDVAAETGGNCELSRPGETVVHERVTILAPVDLPSGVAQHASEMYGSNLLALLKHIVKDGVLTLDPADEIVNPILVTHEGKVRTPEGGK
jgi:NAD(P) transhydrogenase subunit alpha